MPAHAANKVDQRFEQVIGAVLRIGVLTSAVVVIAGAVLYLARHGRNAPHYTVFIGEPSDLRTLSGIFHDALRLQGRGLIQLGLLILIATPIARVVFSVVGFIRERDGLYVIFTLVVLAVLLYSLLGQQ